MRRGVVGLHGRLADEEGIALIAALMVLLVLTLGLTTTLSLTSSGQRAAVSDSARQRAATLAEAGINNAISTLSANYPGSVVFPGDPNLLPVRTNAYDGGNCTPPVNNCVTWSGTLVGPLTGRPWHWEWRLRSTATVSNPAGGSALIARTATAIVPVVI